jgi:hypothetical protein
MKKRYRHGRDGERGMEREGERERGRVPSIKEGESVER